MKRSIFPLTLLALLSFLLVISLGSGNGFAGPAYASNLGLFASGGIALSSSEITLPAAKDNTLYESETGTLSNGSGQYFFAGSTNNGLLRRGLVGFDLAEIPAGSTVISATVDLYMSKSIAGAVDVSFHPYLKEWGEGASAAAGNEGAGADAQTGDATWLHTFFDSENWDNPGGDFTPLASATTAVGGTGHYQWSSPALVQDLQSCLDAGHDSCGWLVIGNEDQDGTAKRFSTRENPQPSERPQLTIQYITPLQEYVSFVPVIVRAD